MGSGTASEPVRSPRVALPWVAELSVLALPSCILQYLRSPGLYFVTISCECATQAFIRQTLEGRFGDSWCWKVHACVLNLQEDILGGRGSWAGGGWLEQGDGDRGDKAESCGDKVEPKP